MQWGRSGNRTELNVDAYQKKNRKWEVKTKQENDTELNLNNRQNAIHTEDIKQ